MTTERCPPARRRPRSTTSPCVTPDRSQSGNVGDSLTFDGSMSTDPGGVIAQFDWNFGEDTVFAVGDASTTNAPFTVEAADVDGDGSLDFVSANFGSDSLAVLLQTAPGAFAPLLLGGPGVTDSPTAVAVADLDGNGNLDIVSANGGSSSLAVFFQTSPGVFAAPVGLVTSATPLAVIAADFDGDLDLDLVSANAGGDNLTIFFQTSPGIFSPAASVLGGAGVTDTPASIAASDLNGDGALDLVCANASGGNLTIFFQVSPGTFSGAPLVLGSAATNAGARSVKAADFDADGDVDLVVANTSGDSLTVFFQTGPGTFDPVPLVLTGATDGPRSVAVADFDGDGDLDLVSANELSNTLTVFLQSVPGAFDPLPLEFRRRRRHGWAPFCRRSRRQRGRNAGPRVGESAHRQSDGDSPQRIRERPRSDAEPPVQLAGAVHGSPPRNGRRRCDGDLFHDGGRECVPDV